MRPILTGGLERVRGPGTCSRHGMQRAAKEGSSAHESGRIVRRGAMLWPVCPRLIFIRF